MAVEPHSRSETITHIFKIVRFVILCMLGLAAVMLFADLAERNVSGNRFLSEAVLMAIVYAAAAEVVAAIIATTCLQLWKAQ
jgi:hypothetical protein